MSGTGKHDPQRRPGLSRRTLFRASAIGGLGLAGAGAIGGVTMASAGTTSSERIIPRKVDPSLRQSLITWDEIDGVPTYYDRDDSSYTPRPASFRSTQGFYDTLVAWMQRFKELSAAAGYAEVSMFVSAGAYVDKEGQHGAGTAVDVDQIFWGDTRSSMVHQDWNSGDRELQKRYYGVDAALRLFFRWGLDRAFNAAHHDHFHMDFGGLPVQLSTGSESDVGWIQAACNEFMDSGLAVDQAWGPLTQAAFDESLQRLGISGNPTSDPAAYIAWLEATTAKGLANEAF